MIKHLFSIVYLTLISSCFGQCININGFFIDYETDLPLAYATIELFSLHTGTIADENGKFILETVIRDSQSDTIEFSYLGYETEKICVADFLVTDNTIKLIRLPIALEEVEISPKEYKTEIVGVRDKKPTGSQVANIFGANKGKYLRNPRKEVGWIKSVSYYLHSSGYPTCPFRVRIYKPGTDNTPGEDLLKENVIASAGKSGWIKIDISEYSIPFPKEGAFIMMEWINSGEEFYFETELSATGVNGELRVMKRKFYGQVLGTVSKKGGIGLWGSNLGNEWVPYNFNNNGKYPNAMINAEVAFEK